MDIDIDKVKGDLQNNFITDIIYFDSVASTNQTALNFDSNSRSNGIVIIADEQTKGRGRLDRKWFSPKGKGLWFSIIISSFKDIEYINLLTFIAGLAVNKTFKSMKIDTDLKWPNDIMYKNKKICGILAQFKSTGNKVKKVVVGIGINVNQDSFPVDLKKFSISLKNIKGNKVDRAKLLTEILNNFSIYFKLFNNKEYKKVTGMWKKEMKLLNKNVVIKKSNGNRINGTVIDITDKGELVLKKEDGSIKTYIAGDISIDKKSLMV
ncbi:MAG: biotin--[acetyl-CoA-carboxylase] ligase [Halanaerobiales bacterium]|nr:biotin--[acetyl-CoA-carboxylase] ligase [Halanaerobiales bacterium]